MRLVFSLLFLAGLASCGKMDMNTGVLSGSTIIGGRIQPLSGLISQHTNEKSFLSNAYAAPCTDAVTASLYSLSDGGEQSSTPVMTYDVKSDAGYSFDLKELGVLDPEVQYIVEVTGCDYLFSRPITAVNLEQDINYATTFISFATNANLSKNLREVLRTELDELLKQMQGNSFNSVQLTTNSNPALTAQFQSLFGSNISVLNAAAPKIVYYKIPSLIPELTTGNYEVKTIHPDPTYNTVFKWKLDGALKSSTQLWNYSPNGNDQGSHLISLYIGKDDGVGNIDLSSRYLLRTFLINVPNNITPIAPNISIANSVVSNPNIQIDLDTAFAFANCDSFEKLALTENIATAPTNSSLFNITCSQAVSQTIPFTVSSGNGLKVLRLWAMDSSGIISTSPKTLNITKISDVSVPTGLAASATNGSVALSWTASTGSGTITYNVLRSETNGSGYSAVSTAQSGTTYTDSAVTNGTTYYYVVSASNAGGTSANSTQVSAAPIAIPSVPAGLAATATNGSVALSWTASTGSGTITYNVLRSTTNGSGYSAISTSQSGTTYTDSAVTNGTTYYYVVSATNAGGTSANSTQVSAAPIAIPSVPAGLAATATNGSVALSWSASTGSGTITYNVFRSTTSGSGYSSIATAQSGTTYTDSTVSNGTTYYYVVSAANAGGASANSTQVSALPMLPPLTPTGLTATGAQSYIQLNWTATSGLGTITYNILRSETNGSGYTSIAPAQSGTTYSDLTALTGTTYYYVVTASNAGGTSSNSGQVSATALGSFSISAVAVNGGSALRITWGSSTGAISYSIRYGITTGSYGTTLTSQTSPTTITGLTAGTTYYFIVTAINTSGSINAAGESSGIPMAAFAMSAATVAPNSSSVSWASSTGATSYTLKYGTATGTYGAPTSATSPANVTGLTGATTYFYRVTAVNASGSLDSSAEISQTTSLATAQQWPFNATPNPALTYDYDSSLIEFTGDKGQLTGTDQVDENDSATTGFKLNTSVGLIWDSTNNYLRLDQTAPVNNSSLDTFWPPSYSSLINYWKMNNNWNDSVGSRNGTALGSATFTSSAKVGSHSGTFDGVDDYVSLGTGNPFSGANFTLSAWVYPTAAVANATIISKYNTVGNKRSFTLFSNYNTNNNNSASCIVSTTGANFKILNSAANTLPQNTWSYVSCTYSAGTLILYINGLQVDIDSAAPTGAAFNTDSEIRIGSAQAFGGSVKYFTGKIDEASMWNVALTASQIQSIYNRQSIAYSGILTSRVMDALQTGANWTTLSWIPTFPFAKDMTTTNELQIRYTGLLDSNGNSGDSSLATGLVSYWKLNEASWNGTTGEVIDSKGTTPGTSENGASTVSEGKLGRAGNFNGGNAVNLGTGNLVTGNQLSLSAWVYHTLQTGSYIPIISKHDGVNNLRSYSLSLIVTAGVGNVHFRVSSSGSNFTDATLSIGTIPKSTWIHITSTYNAGALRIYVNGIEQAVTYTNQGDVTGSIDSNTAYNLIGGAYTIGSPSITRYFTGLIDDVGMWSRELSPNEVKQLYRRGANQIKFQVRNCTVDNCSDDLAGANWKGPGGTNQSYFSEIFNMETQSASPSGTTNTTLPSMLFSNFTTPVGTSQYFQYRTIMESDDTTTSCDYGSGPTWCSPELKKVTLDPVHYNSSAPTIINKTGVSYSSLSNFVQTLGSGGCSSGAVYNLGVGASYGAATWYWWNGTVWTTAGGTTSSANSAATIASNISTFATQVGTGTVYFKAFLRSSGTTNCEIDHLELNGVL